MPLHSVRLLGRVRVYFQSSDKFANLAKLREKDLLKEFEEYRQSKQKKPMVFHLAALLAGFKEAYIRQDYQSIVDMAAKILKTVLQEDTERS
jgi:hypothetical protein